MAGISMRGLQRKALDRGLWCQWLNGPIDGRFRDCEHYQADKVRVHQYRWLLSSTKHSKTGVCFKVCVASCANCLHSINIKDSVR